MNNRRDFIRNAFLAMGGLSLPGMLPRLSAAELSVAPGKTPPIRFIFLHRSNGLFPKVCVPPTFGSKEMELEKQNAPYEVDLDKHTLPEWMAPLEKHKADLTILQGLSGMMCTTGHSSWCSSLGCFKANERPSSIKWATVDFELAKLFPSPLEHIEFACFPTEGGNARGSADGIGKGFSARGPQQPNYAFGGPGVAVQEIFKSVATNKNEQIQYQLERKLLQYTASTQAGLAEHLAGLERRKISTYADSLRDIEQRNRKVDMMADIVRRHVPKLEAKYLKDDMSVYDRQMGHAEVLLASMISGLTNVAAFTMDELGVPYTGIPGLEGEKVNMHDVGHGKSVGGIDAAEIRHRTEFHHMEVVNHIVSRLKQVPEGKGTMFDNTFLCYYPDTGETHHSYGWEFPFIVLAGKNVNLKNLGRRYIRLPYWGKEGHKTLGNWYTTILNAHGNPIRHYGDFDLGLKIPQEGPIKQFLG